VTALPSTHTGQQVRFDPRTGVDAGQPKERIMDEIGKILITGGCRCGKSTYALNLAEGHTNRVFMATAEARDREMAERIERHKRQRNNTWRTIEEPLELAGSLAREMGPGGLVVIDCLTLWLSNLLVRGDTCESIMDKVNTLTEMIQDTPGNLIVITNEVGWGIVPEHELARQFRDLAGFANQRLAEVCSRVVLMVSGLPVIIKGESRLYGG
jgi:adenosyl cobinamide kinase/adenosyl cobinamide phosphate guanylyltransferase